MVTMRIFGTPVKVKAAVCLLFVALWGGTTWLGLYWHPERGFWQALLIGFVTTILLLLVDFGHALAHIFSARYAGAPIDEILLSAPNMPRTLYSNNSASWGGIIGVGLIALQLWLAGMIVLGIGMVVIGVAAGKIR